MNNKVVIAIIAVIVIIAAAFLLTREKDNTEVASNTEATAQAETESGVSTGSIKSLIEAGRTQTCTFKSTEQNVSSEGTMYVSGGKMRGDFNSEVSGVKNSSHMLYDGTTSYVWVDGQNTGFKMSLDANAQSNTSTQGVDPNKNYEYKCSKWSTDNSKFELPSGVTFSELPSMQTNTDAAAGASANTKALQQSICNNLSEPQKTQCLNAIK